MKKFLLFSCFFMSLLSPKTLFTKDCYNAWDKEDHNLGDLTQLDVVDHFPLYDLYSQLSKNNNIPLLAIEPFIQRTIKYFNFTENPFNPTFLIQSKERQDYYFRVYLSIIANRYISHAYPPFNFYPVDRETFLIMETVVTFFATLDPKKLNDTLLKIHEQIISAAKITMKAEFNNFIANN